jgi:hypothetical protein
MLTDAEFRRKHERSKSARENASDAPEKRESDDVRAEGRRAASPTPRAPSGAQWVAEKRVCVLKDSLWLAYFAARVPYGVGATAPRS